ncbi:MAG: manno-octulosonate cytidylyltransferase [Pseudomonadota bacterium]
MSAVILIPARYASSRFPGKPLVPLTQADGSQQSLIEMSWRAAQQVAGVDAVHVLTDDDRIRDGAERFGASVIMTSAACRNGTERCAEAVATGAVSADIVVNFQGDAPLTPPWFVEALIARLAQTTSDECVMATPVLRCDAAAYAKFTEDRRAGRVGATTAVFDRDERALYFSKEVLPYLDPSKPQPDPLPVFHHVGIYAFRPAALQAYAAWREGPLERHEGLEQLRFLENGGPVACVEVDARGRHFWEVNNPEDVARIEALVREQAG